MAGVRQERASTRSRRACICRSLAASSSISFSRAFIASSSCATRRGGLRSGALPCPSAQRRTRGGRRLGSGTHRRRVLAARAGLALHVALNLLGQLRARGGKGASGAAVGLPTTQRIAARRSRNTRARRAGACLAAILLRARGAGAASARGASIARFAAPKSHLLHLGWSETRTRAAAAGAAKRCRSEAGDGSWSGSAVRALYRLAGGTLLPARRSRRIAAAAQRGGAMRSRRGIALQFLR